MLSVMLTSLIQDGNMSFLAMFKQGRLSPELFQDFQHQAQQIHRIRNENERTCYKNVKKKENVF